MPLPFLVVGLGLDFTSVEPYWKCIYSYINHSKMLVTQSCLILCNSWTVARQAPLSMEFSRQKYWSGLPFPSAGDLPDPGIKLEFPAL